MTPVGRLSFKQIVHRNLFLYGVAMFVLLQSERSNSPVWPAFYTVVTGWIIYYFVRFLTGRTEDLGFVTMITNPGVNVTYLAVTVIVAFGILCFNLQGGLEALLLENGVKISLIDTHPVLGYKKFTANDDTPVPLLRRGGPYPIPKP